MQAIKRSKPSNKKAKARAIVITKPYLDPIHQNNLKVSQKKPYQILSKGKKSTMRRTLSTMPKQFRLSTNKPKREISKIREDILRIEKNQMRQEKAIKRLEKAIKRQEKNQKRQFDSLREIMLQNQRAATRKGILSIITE